MQQKLNVNLLTVFRRNLSEMEKQRNEAKQASEVTGLHYEKEKTLREEIQGQLARTQEELGGKSWWWETQYFVLNIYIRVGYNIPINTHSRLMLHISFLHKFMIMLNPSAVPTFSSNW